MTRFGSGEVLPELGQVVPYSSVGLPAGWNAQRFERVRGALQRQSCAGCHGSATSTSGNQFELKEPGRAAAISRFLEHAEIPRRLASMRALVCGPLATPLAGENNAQFVGPSRAATCVAAPSVAELARLPSPRINEVRATSPMAGYIELVGPPGASLDGYSITADSSLYVLDGYTMGDDGYFVVASDSTLRIPPGTGFKLLRRRELLGDGHAFALSRGATVVDAVALGPATIDPYSPRGEGARADVPGDRWNALARAADATDTNENHADFKEQHPTPGAPNCIP